MSDNMRPWEAGDGKLLLSLDYGWLESPNIFSQLQIIDEVLRQYAYDKELPPDTVKAHEVFDMIIGTGSGGLLAAMLGPLQMTTQEARSAFDALQEYTFNPPKSWFSRLIDSLNYVLRKLRNLDTRLPNLDAEVLGKRLGSSVQQLVEEQLGINGISMKMQDIQKLIPGCYFAVTAMTSAHVAAPAVFRGYRSRTWSPDCTLIEALRATMADARLFFPVTLGKPIPQTYIGADAGHPNPIETVVQEAETVFGRQSISTILSIGSGRHQIIAVNGPTDFPEAMVKLVSSAQAASERTIARFSHHQEVYHRLEVDYLHPPATSSRASVYVDSLTYLNREEVRQRINELVSLMCSRRGIIAVEEIGHAKPGATSRAVEDMPKTTSTYDNIKTLPYPERASFNPHHVCFEGTRGHILSVIIDWMVSEGIKPSVLWLEGVFGSGKSFIAHSVAVEAHRRAILGSSFFMTPGTSIREGLGFVSNITEPPSLKNVISSLLADLAGLSDEFRWTVGTLLARHPRLATATPSVQMTELLMPSLSCLPGDRTFVWVIDGFDELMRSSDRDEADGLFDSLCAFAPHFPNNFLVFVTSRPLPSHPVPQTSFIRHLLLDITSAENMRDVNVIAIAELQKVGDYNRAFSVPLPEDSLAIAFRSQAGGHPLWLRVAREHLLKSLTPDEELEELLSLKSNGASSYHQFMNSTYAEVIGHSIDLQNPKNQKALKNVIFLLLALERPLPLSVILDILDGSTDLPSKTFSSVISQLCPLLLGLNSGSPVEFIHLSLRDFFTSSPSFSDLIQDVPPPRDLSPSHFILLQCGFRVMGTHLHPQALVDKDSRDCPTLDYVVGAWPYHITHITHTTDDSQFAQHLSDFFDHSFIFWLGYHPTTPLPFLFTIDFLARAKRFYVDIWDEKVLSRKKTAETLAEIQIVLEKLERFDDWLSCSYQAIELWRGLAESDVKNQRSLYISMFNLAIGYGKFGLEKEALSVYQESLAVCRSLCQREDRAFTSDDLAQLLTRVSMCLSSAGQHMEAAEATREAILIQRKLMEDHPRVFEPDLAHSLMNLSIDLSASKMYQEALAASEESVTLRRELVDKQPNVFEARLAFSLHKASFDLASVGRQAEAITVADEAVSIYQKLVKEQPGMFEDDLQSATSQKGEIQLQMPADSCE
ncbi:hypothetical protein DL96DRAFT_1823780 [Flagelloscypha sp. PMI_526]|nr:hypothetical protein DL96DRAFT_1823780 [Flagelloscypha sp. PMI_526]